VYRTAQRKYVESTTAESTGTRFVDLGKGFAVAPGDASDLSVCAAHPWQSFYLVFDDGSACGTAICSNQSNIGNCN
jgi:hypothetical protein